VCFLRKPAPHGPAPDMQPYKVAGVQESHCTLIPHRPSSSKAINTCTYSGQFFDVSLFAVPTKCGSVVLLATTSLLNCTGATPRTSLYSAVYKVPKLPMLSSRYYSTCHLQRSQHNPRLDIADWLRVIARRPSHIVSASSYFWATTGTVPFSY
jgi:hypothetical protein